MCRRCHVLSCYIPPHGPRRVHTTTTRARRVLAVTRGLHHRDEIGSFEVLAGPHGRPWEAVEPHHTEAHPTQPRRTSTPCRTLVQLRTKKQVTHGHGPWASSSPPGSATPFVPLHHAYFRVPQHVYVHASAAEGPTALGRSRKRFSGRLTRAGPVTKQAIFRT